jgi:hypothetical protein
VRGPHRSATGAVRAASSQVGGAAAAAAAARQQATARGDAGKARPPRGEMWRYGDGGDAETRRCTTRKGEGSKGQRETEPGSARTTNLDVSSKPSNPYKASATKQTQVALCKPG